MMAVSGCLMVPFVVAHLIGNLQMFWPPYQINRYANFLQDTPWILWPTRISMLLALTLHVVSAIRVGRENRAARPVPYVRSPCYGSNFAACSMLMSGVMLGCFVVYHLLHFTVMARAVNLTGVDFTALREPETGYHDVYAMTVYGFRSWPVSLVYVLAMALLALHLFHGAESMFQSMGWRNWRIRPVLVPVARGLAIFLFAGYCSIPAAVLCGLGSKHLERVRQQAQTVAVAPESPAQEANR